MSPLTPEQLDQIETPAFVIDEAVLVKNLTKIHSIQEKTGCKIILALKSFSTYAAFPVMKPYLAGCTASSVNEAFLAKEEFGKEVHVYAPAYKQSELEQLVKVADHITFNSFSQWDRHKDFIRKHSDKIEFGLRVNPEHSEVKVDIYNPCKQYSRFGVTQAEFKPEKLDGIRGLMVHTLCEHNADALERTLSVVEEKFGPYLTQMSWLNLGGGHFITNEDYDVDLLCRLIDGIQKKYDLQVILEPGAALVLDCGYLVSSVLDLFKNEKEIAILDTSATAHMPDVLEMPYRPDIVGAGKPEEKAHSYRLGGITCLSGDVIGEFSFDNPLKVGDKLVFEDMIQYTMVKTTMFNGVQHPSFYTKKADGKIVLDRRFGYPDFKSRLG